MVKDCLQIKILLVNVTLIQTCIGILCKLAQKKRFNIESQILTCNVILPRNQSLIHNMQALKLEDPLH